MNEQRMKELFSDEAFVKSLFAMETAEEVQAALKEKGVELSFEEINKIRDTILVNVNESGELALDELENVAGGVIATTIVVAGISALGSVATALINNRVRW